MAFDALEMSLQVLEQLAPVEARVRLKRKSLADEIGRAAESVALNVSEGRERAGLNRADMFRRAAGSASELTTALKFNRQIWTIFLTSVTDAASPLAMDVRQHVANLGVFVLSQTAELQVAPEPEKLDILVKINRELAAGLRGDAG